MCNQTGCPRWRSEIQNFLDFPIWASKIVVCLGCRALKIRREEACKVMCGRARCSLSREEVRAEANIARWRDEEAYFPSYNMSPSHSTPVVKQASPDGERELHTMKWGLVPSYTKVGEKPDYFRMFNARSETVNEKGVFKKLLGRQRCVVFLNGFYEWKKEGKQKQPYFIFQEGHTTMRMAGLFDIWKGAGEQPMYSFTILTTDSSEKLQWLHDRMPVVLPDKAAEDLWLSGSGDEAIQQLGKLCVPYNGGDLQWFAVDPMMSNMRKDGPECCQPLKRKSIATFFKPKKESQAATAAPPKGIKQEGVKIEHEAKVDVRNPDEATADLRADEKGKADIIKHEAEPETDGLTSQKIDAQGSGNEVPLPDYRSTEGSMMKEDPNMPKPSTSEAEQIEEASEVGGTQTTPGRAGHGIEQQDTDKRSSAKRPAASNTRPAPSAKKPKQSPSSGVSKSAKITSFFGPPRKKLS